MSTTQSYEDLEAKYETEETPESINLRVHIPDGFAHEDIGAQIEYGFVRVRVQGERSLEKNRSVRFNALYEVPEYCNISRIKGKFDGKFVIITIPTIPERVSKQESTQVKSNSEAKEEGTTTNDDQEKTFANDHVFKPTIESTKETDHKTPTPTNSIKESIHQKGRKKIPQKAKVTKDESKAYVNQEISTLPKDTKESKSQKAEEGIPQKYTIRKIDSKKQVGHEASTLTPPQETNASRKGQEAISLNPTLAINAKLQRKENFGGEIDKIEEMQKIVGKKENKDHSKKNLESRKPPEKDEVDDAPKKENKEESKRLDMIEQKKGKEINGKLCNNIVRKNSDKKVMSKSTRAIIKEVIASTSQAMTNLSKKFNEEDKQRIIYIGATILVVTLGVYATHKLRSHRP